MAVVVVQVTACVVTEMSMMAILTVNLVMMMTAANIREMIAIMGIMATLMMLFGDLCCLQMPLAHPLPIVFPSTRLTVAHGQVTVFLFCTGPEQELYVVSERSSSTCVSVRGTALLS